MKTDVNILEREISEKPNNTKSNGSSFASHANNFPLRDEIIDATDIVKIIGQYVKLSKNGKDHSGLCPFHNEKTPSFKVSETKGIYKCFGCGEGGNVIDFLIKKENLSYPEAIKMLAKECGISLPDAPKDSKYLEKEKRRLQLINVYEFATKFFQEALHSNQEALDYAKTRFDEETISLWKIGFAPGKSSLYQAAVKEGYKHDFLLTSGLFREKDSSVYDYFYNRITFPITDRSGQVIAFTARSFPDADPKWLNSPETELYNKGNSLFGIHYAAREIKKEGAILVEGAGDCIALNRYGSGNAVAPCGTALTPGQLSTIKRYSNQITFIYDGDDAGNKALLKNAKSAIESDFRAYLVRLPDKEDPESFFKSQEHFQKYFTEHRQDYLLWYASKLFGDCGNDPIKKENAIKEISELLTTIDETRQAIYLPDVAKKFKLKEKIFTDLLKGLKPEPKPQHGKDSGDSESLFRYGFIEEKNRYQFQTKDDFADVSNFIMEPLFHIQANDESARRYFKLTNSYNHEVVTDLDMAQMNSNQALRRKVEGLGNFLIWASEIQFNKIKIKLYENTKTATEIKILGWQPEGFFAWANGISTIEGKFIEVNSLGLVDYNDKTYFIPAFSSVYLSDKSLFTAERKFRYHHRDVVLKDFADLMLKVYNVNARFGLCFWIATTFRDFIINIFKNFPILNFFGPKGCGKNELAYTLRCLYGPAQDYLVIHNTTKAGIAEHVQQFCNALAFVDEYKNSLEFSTIEILKSFYNATGRSRLNIDRRKETTLVLSGIILAGQEMPTADIALFSRLIFLHFHKSEYGTQEKKYLDDLKELQDPGLSHFTHELIRHRKYFENEFFSNYEETLRDLNDQLEDQHIEDRILRNWCTLAASLRTLQNKVDLGFTYEDLREDLIAAIKYQNEQTTASNEITTFWKIFEGLYDKNILINNWHFKIGILNEIKGSKGNRTLKKGTNVLRFKFNAVYPLYAEQALRIKVNPLPDSSLRYYLENSRSFLGIYDKVKFQISAVENKFREEESQTTTAYCFTYEDLKINLLRIKTASDKSPNNDNDEAQINDDFPF
jgi:DNA primase